MYKGIYKHISKQDVRILRIEIKINSVKRAVKKTRDDHSNQKYTGQDIAPFRVLLHEGFRCSIIKHKVFFLIVFRRHSADFLYPASPHGHMVGGGVRILGNVHIRG